MKWPGVLSMHDFRISDEAEGGDWRMISLGFEIFCAGTRLSCMGICLLSPVWLHDNGPHIDTVLEASCRLLSVSSLAPPLLFLLLPLVTL